MRFAARLTVAIAPLLLTVLFAWLLAEGHVNFGGEEKALFLTVPPLLWSLVFFLCYVALWSQGFGLARSAAVAAGVATGPAALAWVALFLFSWLVVR